jgi:hypothetical protein
MPSLSGSTPVPVLRQALRGAVASTSLRHASRQVGMSPTGLQKFIDGGHPYSATRRKLERWYVLHGPGRLEAGLSGASALAILQVLVHDLSPARHRSTMERLLASMEEAYAAASLPPPQWLGELRGEMEREHRA